MSELKVPKGSLPSGYSFVPKGNVFITSNCRKKTQESGRSVYVVMEAKKKQIGIGVPTGIYMGVQFKEMDTRAERAANVVKRDEGLAKGFQKEIMNIFPQIPPDALQNVAKIALQKGKGKVGRVGKLDVQRKARLAVWAHVRHCETDYDALLRKGMPREDARKQVEAKMKEVCKAWGVGSQATRGKPGKPSRSLARQNIKTTQATKGAKKDSVQPKKAAKTSISTTAITSVGSPRTSKKAAQFTNGRKAAVRNAKRAYRQKQILEFFSKKQPIRQQKKASRTSSPEIVIATAASFRERRAPKPRVIPSMVPTPPKTRRNSASKNILGLDPEQRQQISRRIAQIGRIERAYRFVRNKQRQRYITKSTIESLNNQINQILADASIQAIECSATARQDLRRRMRR